LGFLAQFEDELLIAVDTLDEDYLSLVSRNLESGKAMGMKILGRVCSQYYRLFENF
jgi:hypothetical protein